jgi:Ca2+-binding RTX toxin-like protein
LVLRAGSTALSGTGNAANNLLQGNANANTLSGLAGNDTLEGGAGADVLNGGSGNDVLYGGVDTVMDRFVIADAGGADQINQFVSGQDKLDFSALDANTVLGGHQAFAYANATATAFSVWHQAAGADLLIKADITGDTTADLEVLLIGVVTVNAADFKFV